MSDFNGNDFEDEETLLGFENKSGAGISPNDKGPFTKELFTMPAGLKLKEKDMREENEPGLENSDLDDDHIEMEHNLTDSPEMLEIPMDDFEDFSEEIDAVAQGNPENNEVPREYESSPEGPEMDREVLREALKELLDKVNSLNSDLAEERNRKIRLAADLENLKKRSGKNQEVAVNRARTDVIVEFLPVMDHLEMALAHVEESTSVEALKEGVIMVLKQFINTLNRFGVEGVDALGQQFDPNYHEAMAQEESQLYESGIVLSQWQKGYKLGEMLIRPARVVVSKGPGAAEEMPPTESSESDSE
ncbi:nucleotide exchange factor GrpE [Myxococcota bacterium]|nr:nucleotide exchange factor GrpE [Myxococcota bacterium]MBU1535045.1 nucleotide exchange factor GrpE [Myxococcota bacterium]